MCSYYLTMNYDEQLRSLLNLMSCYYNVRKNQKKRLYLVLNFLFCLWIPLCYVVCGNVSLWLVLWIDHLIWSFYMWKFHLIWHGLWCILKCIYQVKYWNFKLSYKIKWYIYIIDVDVSCLLFRLNARSWILSHHNL